MQFALVEIFLTCFYDKYPALRQKKVLLTALTCSALLLLGIPCVTEVTYLHNIVHLLNILFDISIYKSPVRQELM